MGVQDVPIDRGPSPDEWRADLRTAEKTCLVHLMRYNGQATKPVAQEVDMLELKHPTANFPLARVVTGQEQEDLIASMGGSEAVRASIRWYGERCDLFDRRRDELTAQYPDQFVAMAADDTIIASETLDGLFAEIDRRGLFRGDCVGEFLSSEPDLWIL